MCVTSPISQCSVISAVGRSLAFCRCSYTPKLPPRHMFSGSSGLGIDAVSAGAFWSKRRHDAHIDQTTIVTEVGRRYRVLNRHARLTPNVRELPAEMARSFFEGHLGLLLSSVMGSFKSLSIAPEKEPMSGAAQRARSLPS